MSEVGIADFRRDLKAWLQRVGEGDEVVVTDRGRPVARVVGVDTVGHLDRLVADGVLTTPPGGRPRAVGRARVPVVGEGSDQPTSDAVVADRDDRRP